MRTIKVILTLFGVILSFQCLRSESAFAVRTKKSNTCDVALRSSNKGKELKRLIEAGFSESVALRILKYYPKNLYKSFFNDKRLGMSLVYRGIGHGGNYDPIYAMNYFNVIEDPVDAITESQKWIKARPFKIKGVLYTALVLELELPTSIYPGEDNNWKISPWKIPNDAIFIRQIGLADAKTDEIIWIPFDQLYKYDFEFDLRKKRSSD